MSYVEGDGILESFYYLLWRKDSPYIDELNISIPDTIILKRGRPIAWYFTNKKGEVLKKKIGNISYENIIQTFSKGVKKGEVAGYFIKVDEDKKLARVINYNMMYGTTAQKMKVKDAKSGEAPESEIEYYTPAELQKKFSKNSDLSKMDGILQKFVKPYSDHNELIQAIWSPRVCVFNKQVNLRRINETNFDIYERALTFDGPAFYSKNVPLRGGIIPGKLRTIIDMMVSHIAHISFEKVLINRMVAYFKVDKNEKVWFLWSSSIRIKEASKIHKRFSQWLGRPLCLDPLIKTPANVRFIQSYQSTRPAKLQMNDKCTICGKEVATESLVPVQYKHLLGNNQILQRSEAYYSKELNLMNTVEGIKSQQGEKPQRIKKSIIGIPIFIKAFHPEITLKDYQILREKEHFLMQKTNVCDTCFLLVSGKHQGGYPFNFTVPNNRPKTAQQKLQSLLSEDDEEQLITSIEHPDQLLQTLSKEENKDNSYEDSLAKSIDYDQNPTIRVKKGMQPLRIDPEFAFTGGSKPGTASTQYNSSKAINNAILKTLGQMPTSPDGEPIYLGQKDNKFEDSSTNMDDFSHLKSDIFKMMGGTDSQKIRRNIQSAQNFYTNFTSSRPATQEKGGKPSTRRPLSQVKSGPIRPHTQQNQRKQLSTSKISTSKYKLNEVDDLFDDSIEGMIGLEENLLRSNIQSAKQDAKSQTQLRDARQKTEIMQSIQSMNRMQSLEKNLKSRQTLSDKQKLLHSKTTLNFKKDENNSFNRSSSSVIKPQSANPGPRAKLNLSQTPSNQNSITGSNRVKVEVMRPRAATSTFKKQQSDFMYGDINKALEQHIDAIGLNQRDSVDSEDMEY